MLLFDGHVKADDGSLGKSPIQFNEDDGDETMADVIWSAMAMIATIIDGERKESEFIWDGELSAGGRRESNAISCVYFEM